MVRGNEYDRSTPEKQRLAEAEKLGASFPDKFLALTQDQQEEYFSTRARLLMGTEPENQNAHFAFLAGALSHSDVFAQAATWILRYDLQEITKIRRSVGTLDSEEQSIRNFLAKVGDLRYIKRLIVDQPTGRFFQQKEGFTGEVKGAFYGRIGINDTSLSLLYELSSLFRRKSSLYDPNGMTGEFFDLAIAIDEHVQPFPRVKSIDKWTEAPRVKRAYQLLTYRLGFTVRQGTNDKTLLISGFSDKDVGRYEEVRGKDDVVGTVDAILSDPEVSILGNFADLLESIHDKPVEYWPVDSREEALPKYEDTCNRITAFAGWDDETKKMLVGELSEGLITIFRHERDMRTIDTRRNEVTLDEKGTVLMRILRNRAHDAPDREHSLWFSMFSDKIRGLAHSYSQNPPIKKEGK